MKQIVFLLVLLMVIFLLITGCTTPPSSPQSGPSGSPTRPGTSPSPSPDSVKWHEQGFDPINASQNHEVIQEFDKAILSDPNNVNAWNGKGNALFNLGKNDDAMTAFDKAIAINANYYPAYIGRGNVSFALGNYEEAIKAFDKALLIDPNNKWAQEGKERVLNPPGAAQTIDESTLTNKGFALLKMERNEAALREFESAIAINPNNSWAWQGKGEAVKNLGNTSESLRYFETAISTNPNNQWGWHGKGDALFRLGYYIEAITYFDTALSINKNNQWAWQGKGLALARLGRDQEAVDAFSRSLAIHENNPDTWAVEGQTLMHLGKCSEAKKAFEKSLSFDSNNRMAQEGLMNAGDSYYCHSQPSGSTAGNAPLAVTSPSLHQETPYPSTQQTTVPTTPVTLNSISGHIYDCSYPYGANVGIANASVTYGNISASTDRTGFFSLPVTGETDPELTINATGFHAYRERSSRVVNGGFHLIPDSVYSGMYLVVWNSEQSNPQNWLRKWDQQTQFVIVRKNASEDQIKDLVFILKNDNYRMLTGGRFSNVAPPLIVDEKPKGSDRDGKTVISFAPGIEFGGIAHSKDWDKDGIIHYAEITYDTNQQILPTFLWHEMAHTVSAGGHINKWPSVVSEVEGNGTIFAMDEKIFNCIYNSPPLRSY
jgi:tetratricopeptide (TPR) repeat protein